MLDLVVVITFTFSRYFKGFAIEGHFSAVTSSSITHHTLLLCFLVCGKNLHFSISQLRAVLVKYFNWKFLCFVYYTYLAQQFVFYFLESRREILFKNINTDITTKYWAFALFIEQLSGKRLQYACAWKKLYANAGLNPTSQF